MKSQKGQVLLLVVLTMVVALTVGLSVASRIVSELEISKQNEESQRAFQAAEAGIQQTLKNKSGVGSTPLGNNANFTTIYDENSTKGTNVDVNGGLEVDQDIGADVWLSEYDEDIIDGGNTTFNSPMTANITIRWGDATGSTSQNTCSGSGPRVIPALEIVILRGNPDKSNPSIEKHVFEGREGPIVCNRLSGAASSDASSDPDFVSQASISLTDGLIMKVIPIYNSTPISLQAPFPGFPRQGKIVTSTGTSGDTERKIRYFTSLPQLPIEVFPYSILSQ